MPCRALERHVEFVSISGGYTKQAPQRRSLLWISSHDRFQVFLKCLLRIDEKPGHIFIRLLHLVHLALIIHLARVVVAVIHRLDQKLVRSRSALLRLGLHRRKSLSLHFFDHPLGDVGAARLFSIRLHGSDRAI